MATNTGLKAQAVEAAARYLKLRGYEIEDTSWECPVGCIDIAALDKSGVLVLVDVSAKTAADRGVYPKPFDRPLHEELASCYLMQRGDDDESPIRFDAAVVTVVDEKRVLIRHLVDAGA